MANYKTCRTCGAPLHDDDIAIYRKLVYRGAEDFLCIQCLADYFLSLIHISEPTRP